MILLIVGSYTYTTPKKRRRTKKKLKNYEAAFAALDRRLLAKASGPLRMMRRDLDLQCGYTKHSHTRSSRIISLYTLIDQVS